MSAQYLRKAELIVVSEKTTLTLSELRFRFATAQADVQSPNNCSIRVYNLSPTTQNDIQSDYKRVILSAGYEKGPFGIIFDGTIKQFRKGRESATDTYLDILAADGDIGYNFGVLNESLPAGSTPAQRTAAAIASMDSAAKSVVTPALVRGAQGISPGNIMDFTGGILPRGKVLFGMARDTLRDEASSQGATWSIQNGKVQITPTDGYLPGEAVVLNSFTGLIGIPEQTEQGISAMCLLNPKLRIGGLVQIDNAAVNQLLQSDPNAAPIPFNQWAGIQLLAKVSTDGFYRLYVCEHMGDTRGQEWYSNLICLAISKSSNMCTVP